eukprot:TRINITY_DN14890_c0_g2_i1.p1 TRINITY_DN14890_c0_g2~~TRINITY_DN14890_c0_g2_i1.p1  ORF type:complete len:232 (+),score=55.22 TRINITY_DN14890_c0_g2_i1:54-749(+)
MALNSEMVFSMRCAVGNSRLRIGLPVTSAAQQIQFLHCLSDAFDSFLQELTENDEVLPELVEKSSKDIERLRERVLLTTFHAAGGSHELVTIPEATDHQEVEVQVSRGSPTIPTPSNDMPVFSNEQEGKPGPVCSKSTSVFLTVNEEQDADSESHASKVEQQTVQIEKQQQEVSKKPADFCSIMPESSKCEQQSESRQMKSPSQAWSAMQAFRLPRITSSQSCLRRVRPEP